MQSLIEELKKYNFIKTENVEKAFLKVKRDDFLPEELKSYANFDSPLPIPGNVTISAPHMHAIYLENLDLKEGEKFLEIGCGSGILLCYAKELVGENGEVYGIEINEETFNFCIKNLERTGYLNKVKVFNKDGKEGLPEFAPFDKIAISASCRKIEKAWIDQLKDNGLLIAPIGKPYNFQELFLFRKKDNKLIKKKICDVAFVELR